MKLAATICLCMGVCCGTLAAQQTLIAADSLKPGRFPVRAAAAKAAVAQPVALAGITESPAAFGLAPSPTLYEAATPPDPAMVCTQVTDVAVLAPASEYAFDREQFTHAALKAAFAHDNLVKMAHDFVPGQPLPDAPVPLTAKQKFDGFLHNSYSLQLGVNILSDALIAQATGAYPRFGGGMQGFGQRLGVSTTGAEVASFLGGFVYPTLFHQDPRFYPSHEHGIFNRIAYAASRVVIGRSDSGTTVVNASTIASHFTQAAISNFYVPYRNESVSGTVENALTGLLGAVEGNIISEFWPDLTEFAWRRTHSMFVKKGMALGDPSSAAQNYSSGSEPSAVSSQQSESSSQQSEN